MPHPHYFAFSPSSPFFYSCFLLFCMSSAYSAIVSDLQSRANAQKAKLLSRFFKTGRGEYGEGDIFLGIMVPKQREVVKKHWKEAQLEDIERLLFSKIHEYRLTALLMLVEKYKKTKSGKEREDIYDFYLAHTTCINNWDLVDCSALHIVGGHLHETEKTTNKKAWKPVLIPLTKSDNLWERRIAVLSTFYFINKQDYAPAIKISNLLLHDKHDLIHKAVGWMLREMGKRGGEKEQHAFLQKHAKHMPRTMLRYAIERMGENDKKRYMRQKGH